MVAVMAGINIKNFNIPNREGKVFSLKAIFLFPKILFKTAVSQSIKSIVRPKYLKNTIEDIQI